mmetsp:Transcript_54889/g.124932  ORF Transcript_54889/g.124932 Transcript_54889/m.124932 type:complete len:297 (-) Transcript_54889:266-1156(-)
MGDADTVTVRRRRGGEDLQVQVSGRLVRRANLDAKDVSVSLSKSPWAKLVQEHVKPHWEALAEGHALRRLILTGTGQLFGSESPAWEKPGEPLGAARALASELGIEDKLWAAAEPTDQDMAVAEAGGWSVYQEPQDIPLAGASVLLVLTPPEVDEEMRRHAVEVLSTLGLASTPLPGKESLPQDLGRAPLRRIMVVFAEWGADPNAKRELVGPLWVASCKCPLEQDTVAVTAAMEVGVVQVPRMEVIRFKAEKAKPASREGFIGIMKRPENRTVAIKFVMTVTSMLFAPIAVFFFC